MTRREQFPRGLDAMSVEALAAAAAARRIDSVDIVEDALRRIRAREHEVQAFVHLDAAWALEQARQRDDDRRPVLLHGIPLAVKDIFDTCDFPTEYNSAIYRGRKPARDAECVARARAAGAVLLGKTVTSEFAHVVLGPTANPVDVRYSPGGSSSGSAAAVAAGFVPLALGSQTGGSAIRPASYCGVFGFKPTYGRLPVGGMKAVAPSLDTVALFARSVIDLEFFFSALALQPRTKPAHAGTKTIGFCRASGWGHVERDAERILERAADALASGGYRVVPMDLPARFDRLPTDCMTILNAELSQSLSYEYAHHRSAISEATRLAIEAGRSVRTADLASAYERQRTASEDLDRLFDGFDAVLTYSATGEAPLGHANGDSVFNRVWTMLHVPCLNVPAGKGANRLPIGVQLIGRRGRDAELLSLAREASECIGRIAAQDTEPLPAPCAS